MIGSKYFGGNYLSEGPALEVPADSSSGSRWSTKLVWDKVGDKRYEHGLDRGVLYLPDGRALPWNGLSSIVESENRETASYYFDGMKISTLVTSGEYTAVMKAITYPEEFEELQGLGNLVDGVYLDSQPIKAFDLSYRTLIGTDVDSDAGYKIHILYNVIALPKDKTYATLTDASSILEFEWDISAVQEEVDGHSPTAHIIIDTTQVGFAFIQAIEALLYGTDSTGGSLPTLDALVTYLKALALELGTVVISIVDNGDGTWTATTEEDGLIVVDTDYAFDIIDAEAEFTGDQYELSDTIVD